MSPESLKILPSKKAFSVSLIDAFLKGKRKFDGPTYHHLLANWIDDTLSEEKDLHTFLQKFCTSGPKYRKLFDKATRLAEKRLKQGLWIATWQGKHFTQKECPKILFGTGKLHANISWLAVFNSRKSKLPHPNDEWLAALRFWLAQPSSIDAGIASSAGTTTYDMLTAIAREKDLPLCLVIPFPLENMAENKLVTSLLAGKTPELVLTCQSANIRCAKADRMVCRDRLLANLAEVSMALEIRDRGNLQKILKEQQTSRPRRLVILQPSKRTRMNAGNFELMKAFPSAATLMIPGPTEKDSSTIIPSRVFRFSGGSLPTRDHWGNYLYHYTRACPGPWSGQSYRDYLFSILENEPLCGHSALDTLARMLVERRIRASHRIIRGDQAVISWSARAPVEIRNLRQWNPALIRWTFEPYGIAINREVLLKLGAKPAIYGRGDLFLRLKPKDRFRFQRHEPPACAWKHEHEWRLAGDLMLDERCRINGFIFVDKMEDADFIEQQAETDMPVLILSALRNTLADRS